MNGADRPACRAPGVDPLWFFPEQAQGAMTAMNRAKRICAGCPVRQQCLEAALARHEKYGLWGGVSFGKGAAAVRRAMRAVSA